MSLVTLSVSGDDAGGVGAELGRSATRLPVFERRRKAGSERRHYVGRGAGDHGGLGEGLLEEAAPDAVGGGATLGKPCRRARLTLKPRAPSVTIPRMKLLPILLALSLTGAAFAADPDGFAMYKAADIQARAKATKLDANKAGLIALGTGAIMGCSSSAARGMGRWRVHETAGGCHHGGLGRGHADRGGTHGGWQDYGAGRDSWDVY